MKKELNFVSVWNSRENVELRCTCILLCRFVLIKKYEKSMNAKQNRLDEDETILRFQYEKWNEKKMAKAKRVNIIKLILFVKNKSWFLIFVLLRLRRTLFFFSFWASSNKMKNGFDSRARWKETKWWKERIEKQIDANDWKHEKKNINNWCQLKRFESFQVKRLGLISSHVFIIFFFCSSWRQKTDLRYQRFTIHLNLWVILSNKLHWRWSHASCQWTKMTRE